MKKGKTIVSCVYTDGRRLFGAAAQQHIIKRDGGWDNHHKKFAMEVINDFVEQHIHEMNIKESQPRLRVVNKKVD